MKALTTEEKMMLPITDLQHTLSFLKEHERFKAQMEVVRLERNRQNYRSYQKRKRLNGKSVSDVGSASLG
jgi:hypothetical protein